MAAVTVTAANFATVAAACRRCLASGTNMTGAEISLTLDCVEYACNTLDSKGVATTTTLAAAIVTALAAWTAVGAGDSSAVYTTQSALVTTAKTNAVNAVAASFTDITQNDATDGRAG